MDFELKNSLGWLTFGNDKTNDKATRLLFRRLYGLGHSQSVAMKEERRCRCWGHIINLIVKAFLAGNVQKVIEVEGNRGPSSKLKPASQLSSYSCEERYGAREVIC